MNRINSRDPVNPHYPQWGDGRHAERSTLRELPDLCPRWPRRRPSVRERLARLWSVVETTLAVAGVVGMTALVLIGMYH